MTHVFLIDNAFELNRGHLWAAEDAETGQPKRSTSPHPSCPQGRNRSKDRVYRQKNAWEMN